jgi:dipeptidyl-peptidase-4
MINNTDTLYPTLTKFPYPKAGEMNSAVKVGVVHLGNQETQWVDLGGDPRDRYIPRINWANGNELLVQDVNRPQQVNQLWLFNLEKNAQELVFTDGDDAFIEYYYDADFINDGQHFIWVSERDGWRHLYRVSKDGKEIVDLTPGEFDIVNMLAYNEDTNLVYFIASPDNQGQRYMYKAALDGSMQPMRVTPDQYEGNNSYTLSRDASNALHRHSDFTTPTTTRTIKVSDHSTVKELVSNTKLKSRLGEFELPNHEFIQVSAQDGTVLDAYIMTPQNFDKSKKYPIIFYVYGEPAGSTVQDRWGGAGYLYRALLVQKGFIVASVDNRGTRTPKGRDWRKSIYKKIGTITAQDQVDALNAIADKYSFVDTDRVGIWGHSGGGSSTLTMLFKHADKYHAGVAIAPVPDIGLYDTIYQERYSGNPKTDPQSYFNTSSINFVEGFEGELLLIHGTGDDNVHYQGSERLINELVKHNKQFDFMAYPNRSHGVREGKNTVLHRQTMMTQFFEQHLK